MGRRPPAPPDPRPAPVPACRRSWRTGSEQRSPEAARAWVGPSGRERSRSCDARCTRSVRENLPTGLPAGGCGE
ncbi:hypothetical protein MB27_42565 [Actinoplanes utahensis]|uniref:Uncharacterized protein n=1 Tax=Actinoplanes utahensis TaxID=1869 RepID=A0A0A6WWD8_ACTUT|nr:hypothetical protein MB27_42565 [Actinoplanes utahensis]